MKLFTILAAVTLSVAAFGQTICDSPAAGSQPYSQTGSAQPESATLPLLGYLATGDVYVALPGMPTTPTSFCGPLWEADYPYVVGNMIEPLPLGAVFQAVPNPNCGADCKSGSTQPPGFGGPLILPSNIYVEVSTCSDTGTTATCTMISPLNDPSPLNLGELYQGAVVGSTVVIQNYINPAYNGPWVVTASTNPPGPPFASPFTFSFTASGLGSGDCTDFKDAGCIAYQQGTQIADGGILWQYAGPQDEVAPTVVVTPSPFSITTAQPLEVTVAVGGEVDNALPTGTVTVTSGSYASAAATLTISHAIASATIDVPGGSLAVGTDTLTATYSGDDNYGMATGINAVTVTGTGLLTPTVTVTPSASSITTMQALNVMIAVSGGSGNPTPTGTVTLTSSGYSSGATPLSGGSATITIPAGSLAVGMDTLTATYSGDGNYTTGTGTAFVTVTAVPSFVLSAAPSNLSIAQGSDGTSTITVSPSGGFTGSVSLAASGLPSGVTASFNPTSTSTTSTLTLTASGSADTGSATVTITGTSGSLMATAAVGLTVTAAQTPGFTVSGTAVSVNPGATAGNTSTITVTPMGGFTGSVTLTAAVTSSPAGAQDLPTFSFNPSAVTVSGTAATATLSISTTAPSSGALAYPLRPGARWYGASNTGLIAFALILGMGVPAMGIGARRLSWRARLFMLALLVTLIGGLLACGGSGSGGSGNSGTTPGTYTVTVTGTASGGTMAMGNVALTVQ